MGEVLLYAISIDELRDLFSGSDDLTERLRRLAVVAYPPAPKTPRRSWLSGFGPLARHPVDAPVIYPDVPNGRDLDDLVHGRDLAPDRLTSGWALLRLWLDDASWGRLDFSLDEHRLNILDFELVRAGIDARFALRKLFNDQLAIPIKPLPGQVTGYVRRSHAHAMADAWRGVLDTLEPDDASVAASVVAWLDRFADWGTDAAASARPAPDLVAAWRSN